MKNTIWIAAALCAVVALAGCGKKEAGSPAPAKDASKGDSPASAEPAKTVSVSAATPQEAVSSFLQALQTGDDKVAAAMLTAKARQETAEHDMVVQPPGAPNATYQVGRVEHPENNPNAAYVSCVWSEKYQDGEEESYEVVWVLRQESEGWRVAGMATQLADSEEPVFLDFEDLAAMEDAVEKAESTGGSASTTAAQQPEADTTIR